MKFMPRTGSPPMPTQVLWPRPLLRGLEHGLVGERARARDDADPALLVDEARHDADLAFARRDDARAVRPDRGATVESRERRLDLHHVVHRDALGDADDELDAGVRRLEDRVGREGGRHVDHRRVRAGLRDRVAHGVEHRQPEVLLAAAARRDAADQLRAVVEALLGVESALLAGEALADDARRLVDQNGHGYFLAAATTFFAASVRSAAAISASPLSRQQLAAVRRVGALEAHDDRQVQAEVPRRADHAFGDHVAADDAAEDVDQDRLHLRVLQDQLERGRDALARGAAADVEEVRRRRRRAA